MVSVVGGPPADGATEMGSPVLPSASSSSPHQKTIVELMSLDLEQSDHIVVPAELPSRITNSDAGDESPFDIFAPSQEHRLGFVHCSGSVPRKYYD
jgi:hypothetical protein